MFSAGKTALLGHFSPLWPLSEHRCRSPWTPSLEKVSASSAHKPYKQQQGASGILAPPPRHRRVGGTHCFFCCWGGGEGGEGREQQQTTNNKKNKPPPRPSLPPSLPPPRVRVGVCGWVGRCERRGRRGGRLAQRLQTRQGAGFLLLRFASNLGSWFWLVLPHCVPQRPAALGACYGAHELPTLGAFCFCASPSLGHRSGTSTRSHNSNLKQRRQLMRMLGRGD